MVLVPGYISSERYQRRSLCPNVTWRRFFLSIDGLGWPLGHRHGNHFQNLGFGLMKSLYGIGLLTGFALGLLWNLIPVLVELPKAKVIENHNGCIRNG